MLPSPLPARVPARPPQDLAVPSTAQAVPLAVTRCQRALYAGGALGRPRDPRPHACLPRRAHAAVAAVLCRSCARPPCHAPAPATALGRPRKPQLGARALCQAGFLVTMERRWEREVDDDRRGPRGSEAARGRRWAKRDQARAQGSFLTAVHKRDELACHIAHSGKYIAPTVVCVVNIY